jgi:hypothetical protein
VSRPSQNWVVRHMRRHAARGGGEHESLPLLLSHGNMRQAMSSVSHTYLEPERAASRRQACCCTYAAAWAAWKCVAAHARGRQVVSSARLPLAAAAYEAACRTRQTCAPACAAIACEAVSGVNSNCLAAPAQARMADVLLHVRYCALYAGCAVRLCAPPVS